MMTYEQFAAAYRAAFAKMMTYTEAQVGCMIYLEQMIDLAEAHPDYLERFEAESQ